MPRGRRKRVVQCHDEYMLEEHIGQENYPQEHAASPELRPVSSNVEEGRTNNDDGVDVNIQVIMVVWQTKETHVHDDTRLALNNHSNAIKHTLLVADHEAPSYCSKHQMARDKHDVQNKKTRKRS